MFVADGDFDGDVAFNFTRQTVADLAGGDLLAFAAAKRAVVDAEGHGEGRRIDRGGRQRCHDFHGADGVRDGGVGQPGDGDDVTGLGFLDVHPFQATEAHQLGQATGFHQRAILAQHLKRHVEAGAALFEPPGQHAAEEVVIVEDGGDHGERRVLVQRRRLHVAQHQVEHRRQIDALAVQRFGRPALTARGVEHREVQLVVGGAEGGEQIEHFDMHFVRTGVLAVDLVDHHNRLDAAGERLADHELGLRQHAFSGIDQHDGAIDHVQDPFDFATEVGVARGVDDVDAGIFPHHRGALGENGDAAFALQIIAIERAFGDVLVVAESAGLLQKLVNKRGLAMIDVRDDGDIADFHGSPGCESAKYGGGGPAFRRQPCCSASNRRTQSEMRERIAPISPAPRFSPILHPARAAGGRRSG